MVAAAVRERTQTTTTLPPPCLVFHAKEITRCQHPAPKNVLYNWLSTDSGATWDTAAGPNSQPGTVAHPDVGGWDDDDGFFGQSATIALNAPNSNVLVHVGRFATAEHSPGAPTYHCIR